MDDSPVITHKYSTSAANNKNLRLNQDLSQLSMNEDEETSDLVAALPGDCSANTVGAADSKNESSSMDADDKQKFLSNFSIDAIWEELARIKNHKEKVDHNYQRVMMQLKSPDPTSNN